MESWQGVVEGLPLIAQMRLVSWVYALVSAAHVMGIGLLFGAIVTADLRLLGAFRGRALARALPEVTGVAAAGLALAVLTGALLFATRPADYLANPYFPWKLGAIALGLVNVVALRLAARRSGLAALAGTAAGRAGGAASIALWIAVIWLGRMLAFD